VRRINPQWLQAVRSGVNPCPFFQLLSLELKELDWGRSTLEIALEEKHLQPFGVVHGGVLAALLDAAGFWACYSQLEPGLGMTTVEMKINYLAPAREGRLVGRGRSLKLGRTLGLAEAQVFDDQGEMLAHGTTTVMVMPQMEMAGQDRLPAKFLD
jgi:uncharacterized protein (TIGR00369 family)